jgi:hypothetical protein
VSYVDRMRRASLRVEQILGSTLPQTCHGLDSTRLIVCLQAILGFGVG